MSDGHRFQGPHGRLWRASASLGLVGLLAGAVWAGWALRTHFAPRQRAQVVVRHSFKLVTDTPRGVGTAPSVVGLDAGAARQAFADAGATPDAIVVSQRGYAGTSGIVVEQAPAPAAKLGGTATLTISKPVPVPNLTGQDRTAAGATLRGFGAAVRFVPKYARGAKGNKVLSTTPAAGTALPDTVTVVYAEPESSISLAGVRSNQSDCQASEQSGSPATITCTATPDATTTATYALGGHATRMSAVVALVDSAPSGAQVVFKVVGGGRPLASGTLVPGRTVRVNASLAGVHALVLQVRARGTESADVTFTDPTLYGRRQAIDLLPTTP